MALIFGKEHVRMLKANNSAMRALDVNCDPAPMTDLYKRSEWWGGYHKLRGVISTNGLEALLAAGLEAAYLPQLQKVEADIASETDPAGQCWILLFISRAHTQLENWREAVRTQNEAMEAFRQIAAADDLQWLLCLNGYNLQLHQGLTEGLEERCRQLVESAANLRLETEARFLLGKLLLVLGRSDEAEEQLALVIKNGNKLFCRREAEALLCRLRGTEPTGRLRMNRANRALELLAVKRNATLDPEPFWEICREALSHPEVLADGEAAAVLGLKAACSLINLGRYEEARAELEQGLPPSLERQAAFQMQRLYLRTVVETRLDHLEEAARLQNEAVALFQKEGMELYRWVLTHSGLALQIKTGRLEGVEALARELLETAGDEAGRVFAHMLLAQYLLAAERADEARPHLEYVAEHGGKHHLQAEAEALLAQK